MFSDCLGAELAGKRIKVHTICPVIVPTNIVATTKLSGLTADDEAAKHAKYNALFRKRSYGPEKIAERIVRAVEHYRDIVPATPEAHLQYHFRRLAPALNRFFAARVKLT
ncbi:hypothetical protein [Nocardia aobensis]|uniref:hypothetical protein n=1 Tax=Nocardia aobensis TaxID=257277 RepID=UPI0002D53FCE|nr:hypothetical protein [Nocardia aobensis]